MTASVLKQDPNTKKFKRTLILKSLLSLRCNHQNDSCIKMGSAESQFNVSLIVVRDKSHKTTDHNFRRERGAEADSNRGPSLTPYRWAKVNRLTHKRQSRLGFTYNGRYHASTLPFFVFLPSCLTFTEATDG